MRADDVGHLVTAIERSLSPREERELRSFSNWPAFGSLPRPVSGRDDLLLEGVGEWERYAGGRDPADRGVKEFEALVGDDRRDRAAPASLVGFSSTMISREVRPTDARRRGARQLAASAGAALGSPGRWWQRHYRRRHLSGIAI
jgi:hypothetical protein